MHPATLAALVKGLKGVLDEHGFERARSDASWLYNILADYSPQTLVLNRVVATVAREGFPDLLRRATTTVESDAVVGQAVSLLVLSHAIEEGAAYDAVTVWATVLGIVYTRKRPAGAVLGSSVVAVGDRLARKIQRLLDEAEVAEGRGDWSEALQRYDEVLMLEPSHGEALQLRGLSERRIAKNSPPKLASKPVRDKESVLPKNAGLVNSSVFGWRPDWMTSCGEDFFGRWAMVPVGGVRERLRYCPPGRFLMGSPGTETRRPVHEVELTRGFFLAETPCTQAQWKMVMGGNPSYFKGVGRPVETVSWYEAVDFCRKLTASQRREGLLPDGWKWRLPTEAEWEYAARAGTMGPRYGELDEIAWHRENSGAESHVVKGKEANNWGLHDMLGNVWEWCSNWHGEYPTERVTDPAGPNSGTSRVSRGGSWFDAPELVRSDDRCGDDPGDGNYFLGFRAVLSSVQ